MYLLLGEEERYRSDAWKPWKHKKSQHRKKMWKQEGDISGREVSVAGRAREQGEIVHKSDWHALNTCTKLSTDWKMWMCKWAIQNKWLLLCWENGKKSWAEQFMCTRMRTIIKTIKNYINKCSKCEFRCWFSSHKMFTPLQSIKIHKDSTSLYVNYPYTHFIDNIYYFEILSCKNLSIHPSICLCVLLWPVFFF